MRILAFDTSTAACTVALSTQGEIHLKHEVAPMQHTKILLPMIEALLKEHQIKINELDAIAFGAGPGSFTGTRIACSVAQAFSFAHSIPLIPISSLAIFAQTAFLTHGFNKSFVVLDARMGEVYWGQYVVEDQLVRAIAEDQLCNPQQLPKLNEADWSGVGDGWRVYHSEISTQIGKAPNMIEDAVLPQGNAIIGLARQKWLQGSIIDAKSAIPSYLR